MSEAVIEFIYGGLPTIIQCGKDIKLKDIYKNFKFKAKAEGKQLIYLYNGKVIQNEELTFNEIANPEDKTRNKMNVLVVEGEGPIQSQECIIKSKNIICPECKEDIKIKIQDYEINLFECKNKHNIKHISIDEFNSTQYIDTSKIICRNCETYIKEILKIIYFIDVIFEKKIFVQYVFQSMIKIMIL